MGPNSTTGSSDLWQTLRTTRAIRRFDTRDVPDSMLLTCLEAATWAPSGGNQQPWRFVVLRSPDARDALAKGAERALDTIQRVYRLTRPAPEDSSTRARASRATFAFHDGARVVP